MEQTRLGAMRGGLRAQQIAAGEKSSITGIVQS